MLANLGSCGLSLGICKAHEGSAQWQTYHVKCNVNSPDKRVLCCSLCQCCVGFDLTGTCQNDLVRPV